MAKDMLGKMSASFAILAALLLMISLGTSWYVRSMQQSVSLAIGSNVSSMQAALSLEISLRAIATQFNRYLITRDETFLARLPELRNRSETVLIEAERLAGTPAEGNLMDKARLGYSHFLEQYDRIVQDADNWNFPRIIELADGILHREILDPVHDYLRLNEKMLADSSEQNRLAASRLTSGLIWIGLAGSLGGLLAGAVIANTLNKINASKEDQLRKTASSLHQAAGSNHNVPSQDSPARADALEQVRHSAAAVLEKLKQTQMEALRAEQLAMVGQMAAGIAHEVRNPLTTIKLVIQRAIEKAELSVFKPRDLDVLEEEIIRLESIVKGFLDFARPPNPEPRDFDVVGLAAATMESLSQRAQLNMVDLRLSAPRDGLVVQADPEQVRQILYNLLFNALEAMPNGGLVEVSVKQVDSVPVPFVEVAVADNGPGIPEAQTTRIFEPFYSTKESGLGLGLSICRRIAESHGGVLIHERRASMTVFSLRLPVAAAPAVGLTPVSIGAPC